VPIHQQNGLAPPRLFSLPFLAHFQTEPGALLTPGARESFFVDTPAKISPPALGFTIGRSAEPGSADC
jgi:hypothetical protein